MNKRQKKKLFKQAAEHRDIDLFNKVLGRILKNAFTRQLRVLIKEEGDKVDVSTLSPEQYTQFTEMRGELEAIIASILVERIFSPPPVPIEAHD